MSDRARSLYELRQMITSGARQADVITELDKLITLDGPPDFDELLAVALDRGADRGIYPEPLQRAIAHALPRLWIATGWVRLEKERRYERRIAATGAPIAWVWTSSEWWDDDRHESDLGTWVCSVYDYHSMQTIERPNISRKCAWETADSLLLGDGKLRAPWVLAPSECPICRGSGELVRGDNSERCYYCRGTGEIAGGEG